MKLTYDCGICKYK